MVKCLILLPKRVSTSFMIPGPLSSCTEFFFLPVCVWLHDIIRNYHEGMSIYSLGHKCCNTITFAPSPLWRYVNCLDQPISVKFDHVLELLLFFYTWLCKLLRARINLLRLLFMSLLSLIYTTPFNVEVTFMFMDWNAKSNWQKQHWRKGRGEEY